MGINESEEHIPADVVRDPHGAPMIVLRPKNPAAILSSAIAAIGSIRPEDLPLPTDGTFVGWLVRRGGQALAVAGDALSACEPGDIFISAAAVERD